jgi:hypothetical protein
MKSQKGMTAKIKTKSNFRNLNGTFQPVYEIVGTRVTCLVEIDGKVHQTDFNQSEIEEYKYHTSIGTTISMQSMKF